MLPQCFTPSGLGLLSGSDDHKVGGRRVHVHVHVPNTHQLLFVIVVIG